MAEKLFVLEEHVDPVLTSHFLRLAKEQRADFIYGLYELYKAIPEHEDPCRDLFAVRPSTLHAIEKYDMNIEDWYTREALLVAIGLGSQKGKMVLRDFIAIATGKVVLSEGQKQMLSNLSNGDARTARDALGLFGEQDFQFPLLDIGTGKNAWLARDVLKKHPGEVVVSTSVHLAHPQSPMREELSGISRGEIGNLIACNAEDLPFADDSFQQVVSINATPYYTAKESLPQVFRNVHRVLKTGGNALLCAALCDYGSSEITLSDIVPLQAEMDIRLEPINDLGRHSYSRGVDYLVAINK